MKFVLTVLFCLSAMLGYSQSITPQVIASAGDHFEASSGHSLSWTMGELAIETYSASDQVLTQGFHQVFNTVTAIGKLDKNLIDVVAFPNPSHDYITLKSDAKGDFSLQVYDIKGQLIKELDGDVINQPLDLSTLASGSYVLKLFLDQKPVARLLVEKIQ